MTKTLAHRIFGLVIFWTAVTGIFAWLPLVRIMGRPEGYTWSVLGLSGAGTEGPYWVFAVLTTGVLTMLFTAFRGPKTVCYPLLILWHLAVTGVVLAGVVLGGSSATLQGQGLGFEIPLWILSVPFVAFTALVVGWVALDRKTDVPPATPWGRANTVRLVASLAVLVVALLLFRAGTNYNWVTALAIVTTIVHWTLLIEAFGAGTSRSHPRAT